MIPPDKKTYGFKLKLIHLSKRKQQKFQKTLGRKIGAYQNRFLGPGRFRPLGVLARDSQHRLVGGVFGVTVREWLAVEFLWLDRKHRRHGVGSEMMSRLEQMGFQRDCRWSTVSTGESQAPWFYPAVGYRCVGKKRFFRREAGYFYAKKLKGRWLERSGAGKAAPGTGITLRCISGSFKKRDRFMKLLDRRIKAFLGRKVGPLGAKLMYIEARDGKGKLAGGLWGETYWNWLQVYQIWVRTSCRRQGLGTRLMRMAELEARRRGCAHAWTIAYDIHDPFFRRCMGFRPFARFKNFPKGHRRYCLSKDLKGTCV